MRLSAGTPGRNRNTVMPTEEPQDDAPIPDRSIPVVYPSDGTLVVKRRGVPKTGKYPFRAPKREAKRQRPHDWAKSDQWKPIFLEALAHHGTISAAADAAAIDECTVYNRRTADPEFAQKVLDAKRRFGESLEGECRRRAVDGEDVFSYDAKNQQLVWIGKRKSDILLIFQMKKEMPEYRDNHKVDDKAESKANVNVLVQYLRQGLEAPDGNLEGLADFDTFWKTPALQSPMASPGKVDARLLTPEERRELLAQLVALEVSDASVGQDGTS